MIPTCLNNQALVSAYHQAQAVHLPQMHIDVLALVSSVTRPRIDQQKKIGTDQS